MFDCGVGSADGDGGCASFTIVLNVHKFVMKAGVVGSALERCERDAPCVAGTIALFGELQGALLDVFGELLGLHDFVDQAPVFGTLSADTVGIGAEDIGMIAANFALIGDAGEAA